MTSKLIPDPLHMWREAIGKLEGSVNSLANSAMSSEQFAGAMHQVSKVTVVMQQAFEKALDAHYKRLNLPSRNDVGKLAASLQRMEEKLDRLLPVQAPVGPRPARTRRPSPEAAPDVPEPAQPAAARAATPRARRRA